jgi:hypothetical protein
LLFQFESETIFDGSIKFDGVFKSGDSTIGYLHKDNNRIENDDENLITADLKFYKPQKTAGTSLLLNKDSFLHLSLKNYNVRNLLLEFWIKIDEGGVNLLKIHYAENKSEEYFLSVNTFQMMSVISNNRIEYSFPYFIGRKSWYKVDVYSQKDENFLLFFCSGTLIAKVKPGEFNSPENIRFEFDTDNSSYQIDQLQFVNIKNKKDNSWNNRNNSVFNLEDSEILQQFKFDNSSELYSHNKKINISESGLNYTKSDAPVFVKAPELNINILSNSYELEWHGGDYKKAQVYILEKSTEKSEYKPLFNFQADNSDEKVYRFLDKINEQTDIIYYRVKQVNTDGTVAYSSTVKVGQGLLEPFLIEQNYPNPFNPKTSIGIELFEDSEITVKVYNLEGREIQIIYDGYLTKGIHKFEFDGSDLPSGIYLYKINAPGFSQTKKMILAK